MEIFLNVEEPFIFSVSNKKSSHVYGSYLLTPLSSVLYQVLKLLSPNLLTGIPGQRNQNFNVPHKYYAQLCMHVQGLFQGAGVLCLPYVIAIAHTGHHSIGELYEKRVRVSLVPRAHNHKSLATAELFLIAVLLWVGQIMYV